MTKYEADKWYGWTGGACPMHPKTEVEVMTHRELEGYVSDLSARPVHLFNWQHYGGDDDILVFRIVKEYIEPREWWIQDGKALTSDPGPGLFFDAELGAASSIPAVHVREVIE